MGLPGISIIFTKKAASAVKNGSVGVMGLLFKDEKATSGVEYYSIKDVTDIPAALNDANKKYLEDALLGTPSEIKAVVVASDAVDYVEGLNYMETLSFNVFAIPGILAGNVMTIASWVKSQRASGKRFLAVLPDCEADSEGVVNLATSDIIVGETTYTASQYTARVAGLIAGLPLTVAPTYQVFNEVDDVPHLTKDAADAAVNDGKLILIHDGEKVKIARGVTSMTTVTEANPAEYMKIKLVRIYDKIATDIQKTIEDLYIGKVQNSYQNKLLLVSAINAYLESLEQSNVLDAGKNNAEIDMTAQRTFLKGQGVSVDEMTEQEIKEANTGSTVFIKLNIKALDAIEDVAITIVL